LSLEFPFKACFEKGTMKTKITRIAGLLWLCKDPLKGIMSVANNPL